MQSVTSSNIKAVGHDGEVLEVEFVNGVRYRYPGVSPELFSELTGAESVGRFFNQNIRGKFRAELVEAVE